MNDLLIFSNDKEGQYHHFHIVFSRMREHELYVEPKKCELMHKNIDFLGLLVGMDGTRVKLYKVKILKTWPEPDTIMN